MYNLKNGILFETIPTSNAENGDYETENNVLRLNLHSSFHIIFPTLVLFDYKVIEFLNMFY